MLAHLARHPRSGRARRGEGEPGHRRAEGGSVGRRDPYEDTGKGRRRGNSILGPVLFDRPEDIRCPQALCPQTARVQRGSPNLRSPRRREGALGLARFSGRAGVRARKQEAGGSLPFPMEGVAAPHEDEGAGGEDTEARRPTHPHPRTPANGSRNYPRELAGRWRSRALPRRQNAREPHPTIAPRQSRIHPCPRPPPNPPEAFRRN